jgi:hypothetical protein
MRISEWPVDTEERAEHARGMPAQSVGRAWVTLCLALALHVTDEALTGFLDVYIPLPE